MLQRALCALTVLVLCASTLTAHAALEEYTEAPSFDHFSPTSQPWETVLPKEFLPNLFFEKRPKIPPRRTEYLYPARALASQWHRQGRIAGPFTLGHISTARAGGTL